MAIDGNGNFVVGWKDWINNDTTNLQVIDAELFTSAGAGQGVIQVSGGSGSVAYYDVAMASSPTGSASPSGSTTAAAAVFAAYPDDDETPA